MISRGLAYLSTITHVRCLNFRVRNGNGCDTPAVAAIETERRYDPDKAECFLSVTTELIFTYLNNSSEDDFPRTRVPQYHHPREVS